MMILSVTLLSPLFFFFNDTATTETYTLSLHDALPIFRDLILSGPEIAPWTEAALFAAARAQLVEQVIAPRSEEHTSELQSRPHLVCRLLLEKKKKKKNTKIHAYQRQSTESELLCISLF